MRWKVFTILLFLLSFTTVAGANFDTILNVNYSFDKKGTAQVTNEISIINRVDNLYVNQYSFTLTNGDYRNFQAYDNKGIITPIVTTKSDTTEVTIKLNDQVVGINQITTFIIRYQTDQYAKVLGNNCEIRLPKISQSDQYQEYKITVNIPIGCGKLASASPKPDTITEQNARQIIHYTTVDNLANGIYLLFGNYQLYEINWQVNLDNPQNDSIITYFPLIPDTNYQTTFQQHLQPLPDDVKKDYDGNWLAYYQLNPLQNMIVTGTTVVKVYPVNSTTTHLSDDQRNTYLASTDHWQIADPVIQKLAQKLSTIEDVYQTVIQKLDYDFESVGPDRKRYGAIGALANPTKVVCSEYTDLFIALARAIGIPSREHQGYAFSQDSRLKTVYTNYDILHSWPEYYDTTQQKWLMADPTFGDTSGGIDYLTNFDNSHITFVIHGDDDTRPIPIGGYTNTQVVVKQIKVTVLSVSELPIPGKISFDPNLFTTSYRFTKNKQGPFFSLVSQPILFSLTNTSGYPFFPKIVNPNNPSLVLKDLVAEILPWQRFSLEGTLKPPDKMSNYFLQGTLTVNANVLDFSLPIISSITILFYTLISVGLLFFGIILHRLTKKKKNETSI